eukprot:1624169-Prymnesium_polylepis.1
MDVHRRRGRRELHRAGASCKGEGVRDAVRRPRRQLARPLAGLKVCLSDEGEAHGHRARVDDGQR